MENELLQNIQKAIKDKALEAKKELKETKAHIKELNDGSIRLFKAEVELKKLEAESKLIEEVDEAFKAAKKVKVKEVKLTKEIQTKLNDVASMVTKEELKELKGLIKKALQEENKKAKKEIQASYLKASKSLKKLNLKRTNNNFKKYVNQKMEAANVVPFTVNPTEFKLETNKLVEKISKFVREQHFCDDPKVIAIVRNFNNIKENYLTIDTASEAILKINNLIETLKKNTEIDFTNTIKYLEKVKRRYVKNKDDAQKFVHKFDISVINKK